MGAVFYTSTGVHLKGPMQVLYRNYVLGYGPWGIQGLFGFRLQGVRVALGAVGAQNFRGRSSRWLCASNAFMIVSASGFSSSGLSGLAQSFRCLGKFRLSLDRNAAASAHHSNCYWGRRACDRSHYVFCST